MGNPIQYRTCGNPIQIPWLIFHSNCGLIQQDVRCWFLIIDRIWLAISSHKQSKWSVYKDWVQVFIWICITWKQIWNTTFFNRCCVDRNIAAVGPIYCAVSKSSHVVIYYRGLCGPKLLGPSKKLTFKYVICTWAKSSFLSFQPK